jgi:hypothetical protein
MREGNFSGPLLDLLWEYTALSVEEEDSYFCVPLLQRCRQPSRTESGS